MASSRAFRLLTVLLCIAAGAAHATGPVPERTDPVPTAPPPPGGDGSRFVGPYVGGSVGYACCGADRVGLRFGGILSTGPELQIKGALASARVGWRARFNEQILGVELEAEFGDVAERATANGISAHSRISNIVALKGSASIFANDGMMIYVTAGPASGRSQYEVENSTIALNGTARFPGFLVGAGIEVARDDFWSLRGEYLVYEFGRNKISSGGYSSEATPSFHALRIGLDYSF
ncbi:MAG: outer membrane protein [Gemmobacter sp.]|jgi:outer membrane immunogenic protein